MMKPKQLRYLRIDDRPTRKDKDIIRRLPIEVENLSEWFEFCRRLSQQKSWEYELLTIDFNFKDDMSGPWFPFAGQKPEIYNADFRSDPMLAQLKWSQGLAGTGPNSGLLIGAHMVSYATHRDMPCGVGFHTYHPQIVIRDMSSAMLATQILLASGVPIPMRRLSEVMRAAIDMVQESSGRPPVVALCNAAVRFRQAFLQRAGVGGQAEESPVRLWMETASLWNLLNIFQDAQTEEALDAKLRKFGLEFYDRYGTIHSLDLRSMFIDRLLYEDAVWDARQYLPLADVKPATGGGEPGVLWQFVEALAIGTPATVEPVMDYFRRFKSGEETGTINEAVKRKVHRLIALIFAWLDQYAERWLDAQSLSWDPIEGEFDGALPTMTQQISELLRIVDLAREKEWVVKPEGSAEERKFDPKVDFLPLSGRGDHTITALVREHCTSESPLYKPLRYDDAESSHLSQRRADALRRMLAIAERWGNVTEETDDEGSPTGRYRLNRMELPPQRPMRTVQADLAQRLGFDVKPGDDPSTQLKRIIQGTPGYEDVGVMEYLSSLEERPLPYHFRSLGWDFMEEFWHPSNTPSLPRKAWPLCLSETGGAPVNPTSLAEKWRKVQRAHDAAQEVQSAIMPSPLLLRDDDCEISCLRIPFDKVGGDYYNVKKDSQGRYRIYVGDVCGKGLPAALIVQEIHGAVKAFEEHSLSPEEVCVRLDGKLYERAFEYSAHDSRAHAAVSNRWATLVCAILDTRARSLTYANAGHPSPLVVRQDGSVEALGQQSRPVGLLPGSDHRSETIAITPGDRIFFFTDGLSEILEDGLLKCALDNRRLRAEQLCKVLVEKASIADKQTDDILILVVSIN